MQIGNNSIKRTVFQMERPEAADIKRVALLFPGSVFNQRLLTRFGPLCKFRKTKVITYNDVSGPEGDEAGDRTGGSI